MKKYAVIVAGGAGVRMGSSLPKQFMVLQGKPVLWHTLTVFLTAFSDIQIILVLPADYIETGNSIVAMVSAPHRIQITTGGETRFQSVKNGLKLIEKKSIVFVHDGVRCLITPQLIRRCYEVAFEKGNAIPATTAIDSIRIEKGNGNEIIDRNKVRIIQTPQTFLAELLLNAFEQEYSPAFTDEAAVVEKNGVAIHLIDGETNNIKITTPVDLLIAEKILEGKSFIPQNLHESKNTDHKAV
ncbi:MAG: 2-C-methyl-D-erythritol 4-phosphate cytidylyltransferase [Bacteroidota bacterium]